MKKLFRPVLVIIGSVSVVLGFLGVFVPILPTTPFLLLGAACYIKTSKRLYNWLINNKLLGSYIKNYYEGRGIPLGTKIWVISLLWLSIGFSAIFVISKLLVRIILFLIAVCVTIHILSQKTLKGEITNNIV